MARGVLRSREQAVKLWQRAARLGSPRAVLNMAVCYRDGVAVRRDRARALELYEWLARRGYYVGLKEAGYCRWLGIGCRPNRLAAVRWYFALSKHWGPERYNDDLVNCLRCGDRSSSGERRAIRWLNSFAQAHPPCKRMLDDVISGERGRVPAKHAAGIGWLGDDELVKAQGTG
jgi:hypothetical protein